MPRLTFIVHSVAQARVALATAAQWGVPVYLRSADGAGVALGAPWFRDMVASAAADFPEVDAVAVLDCGRFAGAVLAAFRHGVKHVRVDVTPLVQLKLAEIAMQCAASLVDDQVFQPLIDLDERPDPLSIGLMPPKTR